MAIWIGGEAQRVMGRSSFIWSSTAYVDAEYAFIMSNTDKRFSPASTDRSSGFSVRGRLICW